MKRTFLVIFLLLYTAAFCAAEDLPDFNDVLEEIDNLSNFEDTDFYCKYKMISTKPGEENSVQEALMFRRDRKKQFVLIFEKPEVQKGQGYLRLDDNVWFYDPESRKFDHSSMKENIQNTDAKNSDLAQSSFAEDYDVVGTKEGVLGDVPVWILALKAKHNEVSYDKLKLFIAKKNSILLKQESYSSGTNTRLMRTSYYLKYIQIGVKFMPSQLVLVDNLKEGERTVLTMSEASSDGIEDYIFTKAFIEEKSR